MSRDLIVFGEDWGRHPSSTQHIIRELAKDRDVIWVNSIGLRRPKISFSDLSRMAMKLGNLIAGRVKQKTVSKPERMTIVEPIAIPMPGNSVAARINRAVMGNKLRSVMRQRNMTSPVLWASLPTAVDLLGELGERAVVYYCGDEFGALAGVDHDPVLKCEKELADSADIVFAASKKLVDKFAREKTRLLPHGVDVELFSVPVKRADDMPDTGKVAGFYGSLSEWLDQDLIARCALQLPDWSFVFVGDERTELSRLKDIPNVHLLGPRAHNELPGYVQHWDVSLMPFIDNEQIRACNPLKLREYMAAGSPIVTTPFPALDEYKDLVTIATSADQFIDSILASDQENLLKRTQRRSAVQSERWSARAQEVRAQIDAL
jgi:glycosyltransferase involved in cell wall biosynthesis